MKRRILFVLNKKTDIIQTISAVFLLILSVCAISLLVGTRPTTADQQPVDICADAAPGCIVAKVDIAGAILHNLPTPAVTPPPAPVATPKAGGRVVTYSVETRGAISADVAQFKSQANETLNDARGWARLGVSFQEVATGGSFTLSLTEASQMTTYSATACDTTYSCTVGRNVIINQDRWLGATPSWNQAGGNIRDYRHMVVNHETGHWLGHGHRGCTGAGQPAPVMQQQSIDLQGCVFNPWPLDSELWSTTLGI
ncbi:MAG TPA: DUF3152 domain-containing protein [Candidatus Saccharimonadales bacterium]|jgi:hypothetical protein|nr:DUF3152 domain-containing protein [Candidatus Saccharimonadales bacterium]